MRIAIVGTGISGLVAAHHLHRDHDITVFEADTRIGGHTNTVDVVLDGRPVAVDTGFIVYNERNYPAFSALLRELGVATQPSDMSFGVSDPGSGLEYSSRGARGVFAQPRNLLRPRFWRLLGEIARFRHALVEPTSADRGDDESLAQLVERRHLSDTFVRQFLVPFGASLWSAEPDTFLDFPAAMFAEFTDNHGMLEPRRRPQWRTIRGGARHYVDALVQPFAGRIRLGTAVHKITASPGEIEVLADGVETFDRVVLATHSDQALRILADPTAAEQRVLGAIRYRRNTVTVHTDIRMLPARPNAWASWNYRVVEGARRTHVTYWMNRLQSIVTPRPLFVTLNGATEIDPDTVLTEIEYAHPVFDVAARRAQRQRAELQGARGVYYAGAYWGYGFHEDGVQSALDVVRRIEAE